MAVDRVIISTKVSGKLINTDLMKSIPNPDNNPILIGGLKVRFADIGLLYLPRLDNGTLFLDFNIPKLLKGDNIHSVWCFNIQALWESLYSAVMPVVCLASPRIDSHCPVHLRYWKVNYFEFNFDLIDYILNIREYYNAIAKMKIARLDRCTDYDILGTIYNLSNETLKDSNIHHRIYLKIPERVTNGELKSARDYEDRNDLLNLLPGQDVLRFEVAHYRPKIRYDFKYGKDTPQYIERPMGILKYFTITAFPGCFGELVNMDYQLYMFEQVVDKYHLDKVITTQNNLYKVINNSKLFTTKTASIAKKVVRFLNCDTPNINFSDYTINKYKRLILKTGYHYITADFELPQITIQHVLDSLTEQQKQNISRYKNSDLIRDNIIQYYSIY